MDNSELDRKIEKLKIGTGLGNWNRDAKMLILSEARRIGLEAIGEDAPNSTNLSTGTYEFVESRNQLRKEQRRKLLELTEGATHE